MSFAAFISYKRDVCAYLASSIYFRLRDKSYSVFLDEESIGVGVDWESEFRRALHNSELILPLISTRTLLSFQDSTERNNVLLEWDLALTLYEQKEVTIFPVFIIDEGKTFQFEISLHDSIPDGCTRSSKEIWDAMRKINGHIMPQDSKESLKLLVFEITEILRNPKPSKSPSTSLPPDEIVENTPPAFLPPLPKSEMMAGEFDTINVSDSSVVSHCGRNEILAVFLNPYTFAFHWNAGNDQVWTLCGDGIYQNCNKFNCGHDVELDRTVHMKQTGSTIKNLFEKEERMTGNFLGAVVEKSQIKHSGYVITITWLNPYTFMFTSPNPQLWTYDFRRDGYLQIGQWDNAVFDAIHGKSSRLRKRVAPQAQIPRYIGMFKIHPMCIGQFDKISISEGLVVSHSGRNDVLAVFINPYTFAFHWNDNNDQVWTLCPDGIYQNCNKFNCGHDLNHDRTIHRKVSGTAIENLLEQEPLFNSESFHLTQSRFLHAGHDIHITWLNPYTFMFENPNPQLWTYDVRRNAFLQIGFWTNAVVDALQGTNGRLHNAQR